MSLDFIEHLESLSPAPVAQSVECPLRGTRGYGFDPGRDIPKSLKLYELLLAWHSDVQARARAGRLSIRIMWLGVVSCQCLGHDTSLRQHYKREH